MAKRKLTLWILLFCLTYTANAQFSISLAHQRSEVWKSFHLSFQETIKRNNINLGIGYGLNAFLKYDQNNVFKQRFYGRNLFEHLSYSLGYEYSIFRNKDIWTLAGYFQTIYTYAPALSQAFILQGLLPNGVGYYVIEDVYLKKMRAFENYVGLSFNFQILPHIYYVQKIGIGYTFFTEIDPRLGNTMQGEESSMFSFAIRYSFNH